MKWWTRRFWTLKYVNVNLACTSTHSLFTDIHLKETKKICSLGFWSPVSTVLWSFWEAVRMLLSINLNVPFSIIISLYLDNKYTINLVLWGKQQLLKVKQNIQKFGFRIAFMNWWLKRAALKKHLQKYGIVMCNSCHFWTR